MVCCSPLRLLLPPVYDHQMLRAIVVDDEELGRGTLTNVLAEHCPDVHVVATAASAAEARTAILRHAPDVLFLDVELPNENGFDLLDSIHPDHRHFAVIFVTAHESYALRAIKASAMDYLLKPIDIDEVRAAVAKVAAAHSGPSAVREPYGAHVQTVLENIRGAGYGVLRLALPTGTGLRLVSCADVVRCEGDNNYSTFITESGEHIVVCRTVREFEDILAESGFVRVHKSHLINLRHVKQYIRETQRDSGGILLMGNGNRVEVSRRRKDELLSRLGHQIA